MKYILGVDVGGTKIAAGLMDKFGKLSEVRIEATSQVNLHEQLFRLIHGYKNFKAIGIGMPGQVLMDGTVTRLPNIQFHPENLKRQLEREFKVPVRVINDAKAFTLAESKIGAGKGANVVAGAILGTGVGVGIVINGEIYFGKDGIAGEYEHVVLLDGKMFRYHRHSAGTFKKAVDAKKFIRTLLDMIILSFNPDLIVLGGAWSKLPGMEKLANEITMDVGGFINHTPVKISQLKYPGVIGAALAVMKSV